MKKFLDDLVIEYKTAAYIPKDPISLPHRYLADPKACEFVAFLTALLSYGRRDFIIQTVDGLLAKMDHEPQAFLENFNAKRDQKLFKSFVYRFNKGPDIVFLMQRLQWAYREYESLENLFPADGDLKTRMAGFLDLLIGDKPLKTYGQKFLFAHPSQGGACKRMNMFLRWVVRQDGPNEDRVDLGLWRKALTPAELMIHPCVQDEQVVAVQCSANGQLGNGVGNDRCLADVLSRRSRQI